MFAHKNENCPCLLALILNLHGFLTFLRKIFGEMSQYLFIRTVEVNGVQCCL